MAIKSSKMHNMNFGLTTYLILTMYFRMHEMCILSMDLKIIQKCTKILMNNGTTNNKNMQGLNMMGIHIYYELLIKETKTFLFGLNKVI